MEKLFERIKELRMEKEVTQAEIAKSIGFTQRAIAYWETGQRMPNAQAIIVLAKYFGVSTDYLLGLED